MAKPLVAISHGQTIDLDIPIICDTEGTAKTVSVSSQDSHVTSKLGQTATQAIPRAYGSPIRS